MENITNPILQDSTDELLIQHFKDGRKEAFDLLYYRHLPKVYKRVRYVVPENDVEDVTQEIFIAALNSIPSFRGDAKFSTWLRTLTNHKVAEFYRKRTRKQEPPISPLSDASMHTIGSTSKTWKKESTFNGRFKACRKITRKSSCFVSQKTCNLMKSPK